MQMSHFQEKTICPENVCRKSLFHSQLTRDLSRLVRTTVFFIVLLSVSILKQELISKQNSSQLYEIKAVKPLYVSGIMGLEIRAAFLSSFSYWKTCVDFSIDGHRFLNF